MKRRTLYAVAAVLATLLSPVAAGTLQTVVVAAAAGDRPYVAEAD